MKPRLHIASALALAVALGACGDETTTPDTSEVADTVQTDSAPDLSDSADTAEPETLEEVVDTVEPDSTDTAPDADTVDTVEPDADADTADTVEADAEVDTDTAPTLPLPGFGQITGECGVLDDELYDPAPSFFVNALDFGENSYDIEDFDALTAHGQELILDGNAGGNSLLSEVFAMEVLARCELATLIASETEILYDVVGKITDILVEIDGEKVGVSVVRAVGFPKDAPYTVEQATTIIRRKLEDILVSSQNVSEEHRWVKQILSVLAYADQHVASVQAAWEALPEATRADTILIVTVTHGDDAFMY